MHVAMHHIMQATTALNAPYVNSFGSTETGLPPASAGLIPIGSDSIDLAKRQSSLCEIRLVDVNDQDVPMGMPGECAIRGATLFSGYWREEEVTKVLECTRQQMAVYEAQAPRLTEPQTGTPLADLDCVPCLHRIGCS